MDFLEIQFYYPLFVYFFLNKYCQYFCINIAIFLFILLMTFISAGYYAHQIIESYKEATFEYK